MAEAPRRGQVEVAVNGRFLTMSQTGEQRYARAILDRLVARLGDRLVVLVPPGLVLTGADLASGALDDVERVWTWHGVRGHAWEQVRLPALFRRSGARVLWSPCDWGPLAVGAQVPVVHDVAVLTHPAYYKRSYRLLAALLRRPLLRRSARTIVPAAAVADDLVEVLGADRDEVDVVAPGVGSPFVDAPLRPPDADPGYCLMVGAHDSRKNVPFLLELWPEVHRRTGLELVVTRRSGFTPRREGAGTAGEAVRTVLDPTDADLADLYAGALAFLWPSSYEGYGLPLLEAMACGSPFLSTDTGAARELALDPGLQVLPLDPARWIAQVVQWHEEGQGDLRGRSATAARAQSWDAAADATLDALRRAGGRRR